ncbi:MAG: hypothetical protein MJ007_08045, partial [Paludibacteraceae bacterium]|nr:hypothetical protein [Paludibacteraceae bacterium]
RIGSDGNNIKYVGGSQAVDFRGRIVGRCLDSVQEAKVITLNKYALESNREKAPVWKDADNLSVSEESHTSYIIHHT